MIILIQGFWSAGRMMIPARPGAHAGKIREARRAAAVSLNESVL